MTNIEHMAITTLQRGTEHPTPTDLGTAPTGTDLEPRRHPRRRAEVLRSLARGRASDPAWVRPVLLVLLAVTATLYLWDLGASGWANSFYSSAVQAGTKSWKAFFFGSSDSSNFITVDKPPAALWVMEISARIFGLSSWSLLVPQALEGVAAVALVYATVRRWSSAGAGLLAGAVMALTPVAALMFRYNNPDALLVLAPLRGRLRHDPCHRQGVHPLAHLGLFPCRAWIYHQNDASVPDCAGVGRLPTSLQHRPRCGRGSATSLPRVAQCWYRRDGGWWSSWPCLPRTAPTSAGRRTTACGTSSSGTTGSAGSPATSPAASVAALARAAVGPTGLTRLFGSEMGSQISWLLPAALVLLAVGLVMTLRRARTDRTRAALVLWGGWLLVTGLVFSLAQGIIHPYYTVALAPAIAAIVGIGACALWSRRSALWARLAMGGTVLATSVWSVVLLDRVPTWHPELRPAILAAGCVAAVLLVFSSYIGHASRARVAQALALGVAGVAVLAAPAAYTLATVATPHSGAIPSAGPASAAVAGSFGNGGGGFGPGGPAVPGLHGAYLGRAVLPRRAGGGNAFTVPSLGGGAPSGFPAGGQPGGQAVGAVRAATSVGCSIRARRARRSPQR